MDDTSPSTRIRRENSTWSHSAITTSGLETQRGYVEALSVTVDDHTILREGVHTQQAVHTELREYVGVRSQLEVPHPNGQWDSSREELDQCIVAGGKTSEEIKQMTPLEKNQHATLCDKNRNIKAKDVSNIAKKMGCPDEKTTKHSKLQWIFVAYLHANA
jgi:hypothetical protein